MKEICDDWQKQMREIRIERRILIASVLGELSVLVYHVVSMPKTI